MGFRKPAWLTTNSLAFRFIAGATVLLSIGLIGSWLILTELFRGSQERRFDEKLSEEIFAVIAETVVENGRLTWSRSRGADVRFLEPADRGKRGAEWYWQVLYSGQPVVSSGSLKYDKDIVFRVNEKVPRARETIFYYALGPRKRLLRFAARTVEIEELDNRPFTYVVAGDPSEIDANVEELSGLLEWSFAALGLVLLATVVLQVRYGLLPLGRIPPALAAIRSGKADRLSGRFPTEVSPLVGEINALLDHNAQIVERARTQVGNLAHALKTPLAVLTNDAYGKKSQLASSVVNQAGIMKEQVDHYLARARAAARASVLGARTMVQPVVHDLQRTLETIYRDRAIGITADGPETAAFRGERQDLEEMLGNLMDNACKWAETKVQVSVSAEDSDLIITIEDDGPGLTPPQRREALKRGARIDETKPGSGLGLSIVHDLADLYGGKLELESATLGGLAAILLLPAIDEKGSV